MNLSTKQNCFPALSTISNQVITNIHETAFKSLTIWCWTSLHWAAQGELKRTGIDPNSDWSFQHILKYNKVNKISALQCRKCNRHECAGHLICWVRDILGRCRSISLKTQFMQSNSSLILKQHAASLGYLLIALSSWPWLQALIIVSCWTHFLISKSQSTKFSLPKTSNKAVSCLFGAFICWNDLTNEMLPE